MVDLTRIFPVFNEALGSKDSVDQTSEDVSISNKPPTSMPVPAVPRRAAPPRRKKETPKSSDEPPAPSQEEETPVPETKVPLPDSTPNLLADVEGEKAEVPSDGASKPALAAEFSPPQDKDEAPESVRESGLVTERSTSPTLVRSGDHEDVPEDARAPSPPKEEHPLPEEKLAEVVEEGKKEIEELSGIDQPAQDLREPPRRPSGDEEPAESLGVTVEKEEESKVVTAELDAEEDAEDKPEEQPGEEEVDEAARRARITDRLAKSGGFNPFASGPPVRKPSGSSLLERKTSVELPGSFNPNLHEEQEEPAQPLARRDADSLNEEPDLLATETEEGDKPFDTLKQAEGDS